MIKFNFALLFLLISTSCFAQLPVGSEWKSKSIKGDTIVLLKGGAMSDANANLTRKGPFTDTTYYWEFRGHDTLRIFLVERTSRIVSAKKDTTPYVFPDSIKGEGKVVHVATAGFFTEDESDIKELPGSKKEARKIRKIMKRHGITSEGSHENKTQSNKESDNLTAYENQYSSDSTEIRLSLWNQSNGTWQQPDPDTLVISQTKSYNGRFYVVYTAPDKIFLVRIKE